MFDLAEVRLNLLKLAPEVQDMIRAGGVPLRDVRKLHLYPLPEQMDALRAILKRKAAADDDITAERGRSCLASLS